MAQYISIRALDRSAQVRVVDQSGNNVTLNPTTDTIVDLDNVTNRRLLSQHGSIGQWVVTGANNTTGAPGSKTTIPANS